MVAVSGAKKRKPIRDRGNGPTFGLKGSRRGLPLIGIFNENLRDFPSKDKLPWLLSVHTRFSETFANGFPKESEFTSLNEWEDLLIDTVEGACQFAWVGHVTWNGYREVFFHLDLRDEVSSALKQLASQENSRSFMFSIEQDEQWKRVGAYFKRDKA